MAVVAVAVSGGRDSTALLHCTARVAAAQGLEVWALHVHHGLMPQADDWLRQVRSQARRWGVRCAVRRLHDQPAAGDSVEAWARRERYAALAAMAMEAGASLVLLAHHRRDQAETWLLQALRGGGPLGLAAMPRLVQRQGIVYARPWLDMPRQAIDAYLFRNRLRSMDDSSNVDPRFARSRVRHAVWPALHAAFSGAEAALVASAARAHEAAVLLAEVAAADLALLQDGPALRVQPWLTLSTARRLNTLRAWLASRLSTGVPESLVQRLQRELPNCKAGRWPTADAHRSLRLYRGLVSLDIAAGTATTMPGSTLSANDAAGLPPDLSLPGHHALPAWGGALLVQAVNEGGVAPLTLHGAALRWRTGGERFQCSPHSVPRSLKKQFQGAAIPAWERAAPLLYAADGRLLFVPGLGLDARWVAAPGTPQCALYWQAVTCAAAVAPQPAA